MTLEARYGSARFAAVLLILTALTQAVYVVLCLLLRHGVEAADVASDERRVVRCQCVGVGKAGKVGE